MANLFRLRVNLEYLRFILKRNQRFMVLMSGAMLVVNPVLYLTIQAISHQGSYREIRVVAQVFNLILLIASAFILPMLLLSYMNRKKDLDVYHALPIKQADLLSTHIIASLVLMIVPFTLSWFVGGMVSLEYSYTLWMVFEAWASSLMIASTILAITTFTLMHVGTSVDGLLYAALLNILPLLAYLSYNLFRTIAFLGFNQAFALRYIGLLFPIWSLFENAFRSSERLFDSALLNGLYWLVYTLVLLGFARFFYRHRKHERAESPFTSTYFFPIISAFFMILLVFILYGAFYSITAPDNQNFYNPTNFIFPFFFAGLVYLVMDTISQRSFKNLYKAMIRYLLIALVAFSLLITGLFTKGFGSVTLIPDFEDIESIEFTYNGYSGIPIISTTPFSDHYLDDLNQMTISDELGIQTILDFHQIILSEYAWVDYTTTDTYNYGPLMLMGTIESKEGYQASYTPYPYLVNDDYYGSQSVQLIYHLKDGRSISRAYYVPLAWTSILTNLYDSSSILSRLAPALALSESYSSINLAYLKATGNSELFDLTNTNFQLEDFKTMYTQDLDALSADDFIQLQGPTSTYLLMKTCKNEPQLNCMESQILINDYFPKTLSYLDSIQAVIPDVAQDAVSYGILLPNTHEDEVLFHKAYGNHENTVGYYSTEGYDYIALSPDLAKKILPYTTQVGTSVEPLMVLSVVELQPMTAFSNLYFTPGTFLIKPEYEETVKALIQNLPIETIMDVYSLPTTKLAQ